MNWNKFFTRLATIFVVTFIVSALIATLVPACAAIVTATIGACMSYNWVAIYTVILGWSIIVSLAVAIVQHWNDRY